MDERVMPAKVGIQSFESVLDPGFRRSDGPRPFFNGLSGRRSAGVAIRLTLFTLVLVSAPLAAAELRPPLLTAAACDTLPLAPPRRLPAAGLPAQREAQAAPIGGVRRIVGAETTEKTMRVKQTIAERQRPVAFLLGDQKAGQIVGDLWVPGSDPSPDDRGAPGSDPCGETLVAVGYDDARYSGAFEVMRDCGKVAYEESAVWVRYEDFDRLCTCAVELVAGGASTPAGVTPAAPD